ncbi:MAG: hypothetical protein LC797_20685 [Chloroflexi bacterium]|nr:hypothetical protein [Chloroflexota bacterium]
MLVNVPQLDVQQAGLQTVDIGLAALGPITVGDLTVNNTDFSLNAGHAVLKNMNVHVTLHLSLEWWIGFSVDDLFSIDLHETTSLGSISLDMPAVDVTVNSLSNIHVNIPALTGHNMSVQADNVSLQLHNATADGVQAKNVALPAAGFSIAGLSLNSVDGSNVTVPAAKLGEATVNRLHGDDIKVPSFTARNLNLPTAHSASMVNTAPLDFPLTMKLSHEPGVDLGILKVILHITVDANAHIPSLEILDVDASATVGQITLQNVNIPYDVHNLKLSQVGITTVGIPAFNVS